jgi:serine/threonine-protein kinase
MSEHENNTAPERPEQPAGTGEDQATRDAAIRSSGLKLLQRLGRGSQAVVYKCRQESLDRVVAAKFLLAGSAGDAAHRDRFVREARHAAGLVHPNIITIHEIRPFQNTLYILMEYAEGGNVADLLKRRGRLPPREALGIVRQAAGGLAFAHARGFIHRDIKPANLLLTADGHVKIADLGLARHAETADEAAGKAYGTPNYISPEQVTGDPPPDHRTDLYSLGVTLFEMVAGRPPFTGATPQDIMRQHVLAPRPDASEICPDVPPTLAWFIAKAMAREPEDRYGGAEDFIAALDQVDLDAPAAAQVLAHEVGPAAAEQRRRGGAHVETAVRAASPAAAKHGGTLFPPSPALAMAAPPARGRGLWVALAAGAAAIALVIGLAVAYWPGRTDEGRVADASPQGRLPVAPPVAPPPPQPPVGVTPPVAPKPPAPPASGADAALDRAMKLAMSADATDAQVLAAYEEVVARFPGAAAAKTAAGELKRLAKPAPPPPPPAPVVVHARDASVSGDGLRYEKANDRDNIGFWNDVNGAVAWTAPVPAAGKYRLGVRYSVDDGAAGGEFAVEVGSHSVTGTVEQTGGWGNFRTFDMGVLTLPAGETRIVVRARSIPRGSLMNLQSVELVPEP